MNTVTSVAKETIVYGKRLMSRTVEDRFPCGGVGMTTLACCGANGWTQIALASYKAAALLSCFGLSFGPNLFKEIGDA